MLLKKNFEGSSEEGTSMPSAGTVWCVDPAKLCCDDGASFGLSLPLSSTARQTTQRANAGDCRDQSEIWALADTHASQKGRMERQSQAYVSGV